MVCVSDLARVNINGPKAVDLVNSKEPLGCFVPWTSLIPQALRRRKHCRPHSRCFTQWADFLRFQVLCAIQMLFLPGIKTLLHPFLTFEACHLRAWKKMSLVNFVVVPCSFLMMTGWCVPSAVQSIQIWITPAMLQSLILIDNQRLVGSCISRNWAPGSTRQIEASDLSVGMG